MATYERREGGTITEEVVWTPEELDISTKPNGPAVAAMWAAGIGSLVLAILVVWAEASEGFAQDLAFQNRVGPLSGKTTIAGLAFVVSWAVLAPVFWRRNVTWSVALAVTAVLVAAGAIGTFPKFFELFAAD
ncbi:MAG: hypothetical protein WEC75_14120 [Dehalococcoidia bacterium]